MWSYKLAADTLAELTGIRLSHVTVGKIATETASEIAVKMDDNPAFKNAFQKSKGNSEFYLDGTFVHILNGDGTREWREMKVAAFVKRLLGASALPAEWSTRLLPKPSVVYAFAAILDKENFQERCQEERRRLGIGGVSSALGDGAKCPIIL